MNEHTCPNGHPVQKARGLTCMVRAGYYWCGRCESIPTYKTASGRPPMGMYYGPALIEQKDHNE